MDAESNGCVEELASGLIDVLDEHRDDGSVPIVANNDSVLSGEERQLSESLDGGFAEEGKALGVVNIVSTRLGTVELAASWAPDLAKEGFVIHPDAVDASLYAVEKANSLTIDLSLHFATVKFQMPGVSILIITRGNGEDIVPAFTAVSS